MLIYELNGGMHIVLQGAGVALVIGRLLQTWGMWSTERPVIGRRVGQTLTWFAIAALAVVNLLRFA